MAGIVCQGIAGLFERVTIKVASGFGIKVTDLHFSVYLTGVIILSFRIILQQFVFIRAQENIIANSQNAGSGFQLK
jgi:hypothetical protein